MRIILQNCLKVSKKTLCRTSDFISTEKRRTLMKAFIEIQFRSSRPEVFCKKRVLRNFAKFTGKHLCQSLSFNKVAGLQSWTKGWRQIHKIKQNRFFHGMFYSWFFPIFSQKTSKLGLWVDGWVLAIKPKYSRDFLEIY